MEKAYKYQKWNQHDDIGLEIPYVETKLISTTCIGGGYLKYDAYLRGLHFPCNETTTHMINLKRC